MQTTLLILNPLAVLALFLILSHLEPLSGAANRGNMIELRKSSRHLVLMGVKLALVVLYSFPSVPRSLEANSLRILIFLLLVIQAGTEAAATNLGFIYTEFEYAKTVNAALVLGGTDTVLAFLYDSAAICENMSLLLLLVLVPLFLELSFKMSAASEQQLLLGECGSARRAQTQKLFVLMRKYESVGESQMGARSLFF